MDYRSLYRWSGIHVQRVSGNGRKLEETRRLRGLEHKKKRATSKARKKQSLEQQTIQAKSLWKQEMLQKNTNRRLFEVPSQRNGLLVREAAPMKNIYRRSSAAVQSALIQGRMMADASNIRRLTRLPPTQCSISGKKTTKEIKSDLYPELDFEVSVQLVTATTCRNASAEKMGAGRARPVIQSKIREVLLPYSC